MARRRKGGSWARGLGIAVVAGLAATVLAGSAPADDDIARQAAVAGVQAAVGPGMYVALGDSFSAGPGIPHQIPESGGCQRSDHNYPHLAARALALTLRDVTCSGAGTLHMTSPQDVHPGPHMPQLDALGPQTRVVTLGIGGNDIGFGEILATCMTIFPWETPCRDRYLANGTDELSRRIDRTAPKVAAVLVEIRRRSPSATVFVVGYPSIVPDGGYGCWPSLPLAFDDVPYLRAKHKELNGMLAAEAAAAGAVYVDTYTPSIGRDACAPPLQRWVEPLVPLSPAAPVHPNARGMEAMAAEVAAEIRDAAGVRPG
ncbi:MAG TPA: SGNH/GDSL hydrolase family protein [Acidimicrobiales bacterium]|nr:SGNH/GDSL hydrolase family protein [Acidimicrobiales bacterium]